MEETRSDLLSRITRRAAIGAMTALGLGRIDRSQEAAGKKKRKKKGPPKPKIRFVRTWGSFGSLDGQFFGLNGGAVAPNGNVYVVDDLNERVQFFTASGAFLGKWTISQDCLDIAVSPLTGEVYVASRGSDRIERYSASGTPQGTIGGPGSGDGQFQSLFSLAVGGNGEIYAGQRGRIQQFNPAGAFVRRWGDADDPHIQIGTSNGIDVAPNGEVYVADDLSKLVHRFSASGEFLGSWGSPGTGEGQFDDVGAIAVAPDGNIFVVDRFLPRIQVFSKTGTFLTAFGSEGSGNGQFRSPFRLAFSRKGQLYVVDSGNDRIQQFELVKPKKKRKRKKKR